MRIGILDILSLPCRHLTQIPHRTILAKQYFSIMPQVISVWCRQLGHETFYTTYYGVGDPGRSLPKDLDVVFISCFTNASGLAYALARLYRKRGALTVIGGPHAKSFPTDCIRFFDIAVQECDKTLIADIVARQYDPGTIATTTRPLDDLPTVEERMPEIRNASFFRKRLSYFMTQIPLLSSIGCPYTCDFCIDWKNPYRMLPTDRLRADIQFIAKNFPKVLVSFHDPNFGIKFDEVLEILESVPAGSRPKYIMETSLSILRPERIQRLRETNCVVVAPGIESWSDYSNKAGVGRSSGIDKVDQVVDHLERINAHVPYIQANLIFGVDSDKGDEPITLTKEFLDRTPFAWPVISTPVPLAGTPMYDNQLRDNRILQSMPFSFYFRFYLVLQPKNYSPAEYYSKFIELLEHLASRKMLQSRMDSTGDRRLKVLHWARTSSARDDVKDYQRILDLLRSDRQFRDFHEGRSQTLPAFYHHEYEAMHGRYADLIAIDERRPVLEPLASEPLLDPMQRGEERKGRGGRLTSLDRKEVPRQQRPL